MTPSLSLILPPSQISRCTSSTSLNPIPVTPAALLPLLIHSSRTPLPFFWLFVLVSPDFFQEKPYNTHNPLTHSHLPPLPLASSSSFLFLLSHRSYVPICPYISSSTLGWLSHLTLLSIILLGKKNKLFLKCHSGSFL